MAVPLCPAQETAMRQLELAIPLGSVFLLRSGVGMGRTTVLRNLHEELGGAFLDARDLVDAMRSQHPLALEETLHQLVMDELRANEVVIVDDLNLVVDVVGGCRFYPRTGYLDIALASVASYAQSQGKKLIFGSEEKIPGPIRRRCWSGVIEDFGAEDYEFLCRAFLPEVLADSLDFAKIFRFAPGLNTLSLFSACAWMSRSDKELTTVAFIEYLRTTGMSSNVHLDEVQKVALRDLKGIDDVIEALEAHIVLPLENDDLATSLNLRPKRGVLLAGPPGSGKTTVGRALAHRLKSKFFMLDGTFIAGTRDFYSRVHWLFNQAKQNAPSIIFIDDADVLFEDREEHGLYRYLLTLLDGLESETAGRVCVMMTAMDVGSLPPALVRSGRVELWLDLRLPDEAARLEILESLLAGISEEIGLLDRSTLATATADFTGADLKRLCEDGKALYAYDKARDLPLQSATTYFLRAVETVIANKRRYAEAEVRSRQRC